MKSINNSSFFPCQCWISMPASCFPSICNRPQFKGNVNKYPPQTFSHLLLFFRFLLVSLYIYVCLFCYRGRAPCLTLCFSLILCWLLSAVTSALDWTQVSVYMCVCVTIDPSGRRLICLWMNGSLEVSAVPWDYYWKWCNWFRRF